ncbi:MAG: ABC transporter permease [Planctomycetes bacterium]|nr:ABC transporter permease [Planctomycetota bacterium]
MTEPRGSTTRSYHPRWVLIQSHVREFRREPAAIFWVYVFPLLMMIALGIAFRNQPVEKISVVIQAGSEADAVAKVLQKDELIEAKTFDETECRNRLRTGQADLMIVVKPDSDERYQFVFDPTRSGSTFARNAANDVLQSNAGRKDAFAPTEQEVTEPGSRYIDFLVPGLIGMGIMGGGLWGVGFLVVDMRIRKLLKRYLATPMKRSHFLQSLMISRLVFTIPEVSFLLFVALLIFGVVNHGSLLALAAIMLLGTFTFAGLGLLVACRAQKLETISGLLNATMLPMWILSGIFFSVERFPEAAQPAIALLPLTPLIKAMRSIMLEGVPLTSLGPEILILSIWGIVSFTLALRWFRWTE